MEFMKILIQLFMLCQLSCVSILSFLAAHLDPISQTAPPTTEKLIEVAIERTSCKKPISSMDERDVGAHKGLIGSYGAQIILKKLSMESKKDTKSWHDGPISSMDGRDAEIEMKELNMGSTKEHAESWHDGPFSSMDEHHLGAYKEGLIGRDAAEIVTKELAMGSTEEDVECWHVGPISISCMDGRHVGAHKEGIISSHDAKIVMKKLGMGSTGEDEESWHDCKCRDCQLLSGAEHLLKEKEASLEELEQAFAVFDEDGDGLISPKELRTVMLKLGFEEGMALEDCKRMISAYDEDGDGRICFLEFKAMMEGVV